MTIKERGYSHWDGELKPGKYPWKPITSFGLRLTFKKKFFKFFFVMALIPALVFLVGVYVSERIGDFQSMVNDSNVPLLQVNPAFFKAYYSNEFILFMMVMMLVFAGAGLISDDLRSNSLQLYLARPIARRDYFLGKASILVFFLFMVTLVPGLILLIMKLVFAGSIRFLLDYPWLPLSIVGFSLFVTAFFSLYALLLSSLSKNRRYVAILIWGLYIFSDILFGILYGIFRNPYFSLVSIKADVQQVCAALFGQKMFFDVPWGYALAVLGGACILAVFILQKRVRGVEIIK